MTSPNDRPTRRNLIWLVIQAFCRVVFTIWFRYGVKGREHVPKEGAALLLINHQSFLDPLFVPLWLQRPVCFLARDNLFGVPLIGSILRAAYTIPINRQSPERSSIQQCINRLKAGYLLGVFPEGTRTRDGKVGRFKPGFLAILRRSKVPVVPVGIAGAREAMPRGAWWIRPRKIRVVFGPPIPYEVFAKIGDHDKKQELADMIRERVTSCQSEAERWRTGERS